jgi:protein TonB
MDVNKILTADVLDIIFEGRNKEYGAYELRKTYNKRITYAIGGTVLLCLILLLSSMIKISKGESKNKILVEDMSLNDFKDKPPPEAPPPPPPKIPPPPKVELKQFTPPVITKEEVKEPPPKQEDLEKTNISNINQEGDKTVLDVPPPPESKGTGTVEAPKQEEDYDKLFTTVQIQASFPGGIDQWRKFLERNLNQDLPSQNGAPPAKYTVVVSFIVDKEGNISDVKAETDPGYGTAQEAVRVIKKGPKWNPANQNGRAVIYRQKQAITFMVSED